MERGCFVVILWATLASAPHAAVPALTLGAPAPEFHALTADGQQLSLADFRGEVLVINFWATWCTPCKQELPLLDAYYRRQREHGLRVLAITTEDSLPLSRLKKVSEVLAVPMVRRFKGDYRVLGGLPTNFIIDRRGVLRYAQAGAFTLDELNHWLVPLLREGIAGEAAEESGATPSEAPRTPPAH